MLHNMDLLMCFFVWASFLLPTEVVTQFLVILKCFALIFPEEYLDGTRRFPVPLYFITGQDRLDLLSKVVPGGDLCHNITYLGPAGISTVMGVRVAFLSGTMDATAFSQSDAEAIMCGTESDSAKHYRAAEVFLSVDKQS